MNLLLVERVDDADVIERVFLVEMMRTLLTEKEHAILALRASGYTRSAIVQLLKLGKTTVYTYERRALKKLQEAFAKEQEQEDAEWETNAATTA